jgi:hypothetical protein
VRLEHLLSGAEEAEEARWREAAWTSPLAAREDWIWKHLREWKADDGAERTWKKPNVHAYGIKSAATI